MTLPLRTIAGRHVGAVGLGCMNFGGMYGPAEDDASHDCLAAALDAGVTHWDVAESYGEGHCETVIGDYLSAGPADVTIATKAGLYHEPERHFSNTPERMRASLEGSLKRLRRDRVDLFYVHRLDRSIPIETTMEFLAGLIEEGLIGAIGLSEVAPATLRRAASVHPVAAVQSEYSLWTRQPELGMIDLCAELGATFVAFSPLGRGMFTDVAPDPAGFGRGDVRRNNPRFTEPNLSLNRQYVDSFRDFCRGRGWATSAASLAWTLDRAPHVIPIPGTRSAAHLRELATAGEIAFSDDDRAELARLLPPGFAAGGRYPSHEKAGVEVYC